MSDMGYLQTKIREIRENNIELENKITTLNIRLKQLEKMKFPKQETRKENNYLSKEDIDKQMNHEINNLTFKIQKINRVFLKQIIDATNEITKNADKKIGFNAAAINFILIILDHVGILEFSSEEVKGYIARIKEEMDKNNALDRIKITISDYENKILFDVLKENKND